MKCMQRWSDRQVPRPLSGQTRAGPLASLRRSWRGRGSQGRRSRRLVSHLRRPGEGLCVLESSSSAPQHRSPPPGCTGPAIQQRCTFSSPRARGVGQDWGSRDALSTRETEQTGSLMESNQSRGLESPIAMAAEFPESDKAQSPSLPSRPCPPLPFPGAAGSRAGSALRRVNHCKNKEMKGSPIGELSAAFAWALEREGTARAELPW